MTIMTKEMKMKAYRRNVGLADGGSGEQIAEVATVGGCGSSESEPDRV